MPDQDDDQFIWTATLAARYAISWRAGYVTLMMALLGHAASRDFIEWLTRER